MKTTITVYALVSDIHNTGTDCTIFQSEAEISNELKRIMEEDLADAPKRHGDADCWDDYNNAARDCDALIKQGNIESAWILWCEHCRDDRYSYQIFKKTIKTETPGIATAAGAKRRIAQLEKAIDAFWFYFGEQYDEIRSRGADNRDCAEFKALMKVSARIARTLPSPWSRGPKK